MVTLGTLLCWYRRLVHWQSACAAKAGRPPVHGELAALIGQKTWETRAEAKAGPGRTAGSPGQVPPVGAGARAGGSAASLRR